MRITLDLPDSVCCVGLFINKREENKTITTTSFLTGVEDGLIIQLDEDNQIIKRGAKNGV